MHAPCSSFLVEELGLGKLTELGIVNMAGPFLVNSGMWLPPLFVQVNLRLYHTYDLLVQTQPTGQFASMGIEGPNSEVLLQERLTGQRRLPAKGLPNRL